jgi:hypothetical protein
VLCHKFYVTPSVHKGVGEMRVGKMGIGEFGIDKMGGHLNCIVDTATHVLPIP